MHRQKLDWINMQYFVIGLHGKKGSGKSAVVAPALRESFFLRSNFMQMEDNNYVSAQMAFATPLKQICHIIFGGEAKRYFGSQADKEQEFSYWKRQLGPNYGSGREIQKTIGTEIFRDHVCADIWVKVAERRLAEFLKMEDVKKTQKVLVVFDDVRFKEEATWIRGIGGSVIEVIYSKNKEEVDTAHRSEAGITCDKSYTFDNEDQVKQWAFTVAEQIEKTMNAQERTNLPLN